MKYLFFIIICSTFSVNLKSQTISPSPNQEYCPEVEYTFTVTITKPFQNIIGESGSIVTQQPSLPVGSTFIFKGKFGDANQKQSFRVTFSDGSSYPFEFKKIKSLYYPVTCSQVPNQATITAPRCQVVNIPLTVPNVQWGTNFESPTFCFGSISDFEYQLPANWSIGTSQSTGSNWIPGGNTVTVTTDMSTGDGGYIRIRPRNNCGSGLVNGQFPGAIPISRPGPNLTISTLQDYICTVGGTTSFTLNGLPTGASVSWAVTSNSSQLQILGCFNCSIVTVQRTGSLNTKATLVATVTDCAFTYTQSYDVTLGKTELNTLDIISSFCLSGRNVKVQVNPIDYNASYTWSVTPPAQLSIYTGSPFTFVRSYVTPSTPTVTVQAQNACGISTYSQGVYLERCPLSSATQESNFSMYVSPNPAHTNLNVSIKGSLNNSVREQKEKVYFVLYDFMGINSVKSWEFSNQESKYRLDISNVAKGTYVLMAIRGSQQQAKQVVIDR